MDASMRWLSEEAEMAAFEAEEIYEKETSSSEYIPSHTDQKISMSMKFRQNILIFLTPIYMRLHMNYRILFTKQQH
jgi:predicted PolB exonuclease-like 3'-5' exonuclease